MADKKISQLTAASTPLAGTEVLPIVQSSTTVKVATNDLTVKNVRSNATTGILQIAGPAAASTRIMTVPDANFTAARTDAANSFTGDQTLATGNLVVGTAAKGIDFSANTHAAGMTSELLDWYEEGTWTPSLGGDTTYLAQSGIYTRVGRLVWASCVVYVNVLGTGSVDTISGLPFAKNASGGSANCSVPQFSGIATSVYSLSATMSSTSIVLKGMTALGTTNQGALTVFANGTYLEVQTVYSA